MSLPSSMAGFVPCDRLLQKAYLLLFCAPTWPSHHVIENNLLLKIAFITARIIASVKISLYTPASYADPLLKELMLFPPV